MRIGEVWEIMDTDKFEFWVENKWNPVKIVGIGDKGQKQIVAYSDSVTVKEPDGERILTFGRRAFLKIYTPKR